MSDNRKKLVERPAESVSAPPTGCVVTIVMAIGMIIGLAGGIAATRFGSTLWHRLIARDESKSPAVTDGSASAPAQAKQLWTCGMHPQVIQDHPGECPICHMQLTPLLPATSVDAGPNASAASPTPSQPGGHKVKYWWDPMLGAPSISDKPGKSAMGMDLVPVYEDGGGGAVSEAAGCGVSVTAGQVKGGFVYTK